MGSIEFRNCDEDYYFEGVSVNIFFEMVNSPSVGKFFNEVIKPRYYCRKGGLPNGYGMHRDD